MFGLICKIFFLAELLPFSIQSSHRHLLSHFANIKRRRFSTSFSWFDSAQWPFSESTINSCWVPLKNLTLRPHGSTTRVWDIPWNHPYFAADKNIHHQRVLLAIVKNSIRSPARSIHWSAALSVPAVGTEDFYL